MVALYGVLLVISIIYLIILVGFFSKHISAYYILLNASVIVSCFGFFQSAMAKSSEGLIFGNQLEYMGNCAIPFFMVACIAELCNVRIPVLFKAGFISATMIIWGSVVTNGLTHLFYKKIEIVNINGANAINKEYGPLHMLFPIYLLLSLLYGLAIVIYSYRTKRVAAKVNGVVCLVILSMTILLYFIARVANFSFETMPIAYIFDFLLVLLLLRKVKLYDLAGFSAMTMETSNEYGFVIFDSKGRFSGGDGFARKTFTELDDLGIDKVISNPNTDFLKQLYGWVRGEDKEEVARFYRNDKVIEARYSVVIEDNGRMIHCIRLHDDTKQQQYLKLIEEYSENLKKDVDRKTTKIKRVQDDIIISMASIVENRDNNTGGHIQRTSEVVKIFVEQIMADNYLSDLTPEFAENIKKAAPLHDFGKIAIADAVLNKPGRFTPEEYEEMKKHSAKGAVIVARILQHSDDIKFKNIAVNVAHYHHERWDGAGYPEGLRDKEIPFEARVMALADVFDALVSKRVYKEQMSYDKAFGIIEDSIGTQFDPELCKIFLKCRPRLEALYNSWDE